MDFKLKSTVRCARACGLALFLTGSVVACNEEPVGPGEHSEEGVQSQAQAGEIGPGTADAETNP